MLNYLLAAVTGAAKKNSKPRRVRRRASFEGLENRNLLTAGVIFNATRGMQTSEDGGYAVVSARLTAAPTADVAISLASDNTAEGVVSKDQLIFTPANWNAVQNFRVTGQPDGVRDGNKVYHVITGNALSADPKYNGLDVHDITLTNKDSRKLVAGFTVSKTSGLTTSEDGGTASFTVKLNYKPKADVIVSVASDSPTEGTTNVDSLVFTAENWNHPQKVIVTGQPDGIKDGNKTYHVVLGPAASDDPLYAGKTLPAVTLKNKDSARQVAGVVVTPTSGLQTDESGGIAAYTMMLSFKPKADVTIPIASSNAAVGGPNVDHVTFTPSDWNQPKQVLVIGRDPGTHTGDTKYTIVNGAANSDDPLYDHALVSDVMVVNKARKDVGRFDGNYVGSYTGTVSGFGVTAPVGGRVYASITNGQIVVSAEDPRGGTVPGNGSVSATGATGFALSQGSVSGATFKGALSEVPNSREIVGKGTWSYVDRATGITASGFWNIELEI